MNTNRNILIASMPFAFVCAACLCASELTEHYSGSYSTNIIVAVTNNSHGVGRVVQSVERLTNVVEKWPINQSSYFVTYPPSPPIAAENAYWDNRVWEKMVITNIIERTTLSFDWRGKRREIVEDDVISSVTNRYFKLIQWTLLTNFNSSAIYR